MAPTAACKPRKVYASQPGHIPKEPHWAIITGSSHTDSYDGTAYHVEYCAYLDKAEWEAEINRLEQDRGFPKQYAAIEVRPATIERKVVVAVK